MADHKATIDQVAELMQEFRLSEARVKSGDLTISFRRRPTAKPAATQEPSESHVAIGYEDAFAPAPPAAPAAPKGTPITSPMNGIYYGAASPGAPAFAKEGDTIAAGQTIGLIEAMKVFNEIPSPISGTVLQVVAQSGQLVSPGDVLLYVG